MLLLPLAWVFDLVVTLRRRAYRSGILAQVRLPVPVVVVGNIAVGGAGKTPVVLALVAQLMARGRHPGVVSRGYRGSYSGVCEVHASAAAAQVGDEPLLLKRRAACPVFVGRDRVAAAKALLAVHPECDMIISDDGLQHYRLARDVEIAVIDPRMLSNHWMLPAGPFREPVSRLAGVSAIVKNGDVPIMVSGVPTFAMHMIGARFVRLGAAAQTCSARDLAGLKLHAVAGIGTPQRFFEHLAQLGLQCQEHSFPDHYDYRDGDLDFAGDAILTTEKDAVKLTNLSRLPVWVLPVDAQIEPDLATFVLEKLDGFPSA